MIAAFAPNMVVEVWMFSVCIVAAMWLVSWLNGVYIVAARWHPVTFKRPRGRRYSSQIVVSGPYRVAFLE